MAKKELCYAVDLDGVADTHSTFFQISIPLWQKVGIKVGILTSRPESDRQPVIEVFEKVGLKLDFYMFMPDSLKNADLPAGVWKGILCRIIAADILWDDFEHGNIQMIADFFDVVDSNIQVFSPITFAGQVDGQDKTVNEYAEQLIEALQGKITY